MGCVEARSQSRESAPGGGQPACSPDTSEIKLGRGFRPAATTKQEFTMKKVVISAAAMLLVATVAFAGPKEDADSGPHGEGAGGLDCTTASYVTCGDTQTNAVGPGPGSVSLYGCTGLDYTGAEEFVYELCVGGDGPVTVEMTYAHDGAVNDLDLFLLGSCDPADCIDFDAATSGTEVVSANLTAGTYYVVVDGWKALQDGSPHSLTVTCDTPCSATPVLDATWGQIKALHSEK